MATWLPPLLLWCVGPIRQHQILRLQQKKGSTFGCFLDWTRGPLWTDLSTWVVGRGKYENEKQQPTHFGSKPLLSGWACLLIMSCCNAAAYLPVLTINATRCSLSVPTNFSFCTAVAGTGLMICPSTTLRFDSIWQDQRTILQQCKKVVQIFYS